MSKSLILYSGGVESTALLTIAGPNDILVTIKPMYPGYLTGVKNTNLEAIAKIYNKTINYSSIRLSVVNNIYVHQLWYFVAIAGVWVAGDPSITRVISGRHTEEPLPVNKPIFDVLLSAWNIMHPNVAFEFPLGHLTKLEQWNMIPENIQPLVNSCSFGTACGICNKCKEVERLIKSST